MKIWKKVLGWMLCAMMVAGMLPTMEKKAQAEPVEETTAVDTDESGIKWDGDKNCYVISNYAGLVEFAKIVNDKDYNPDGLEDCSSANAVIDTKVDSIDASASALPVDDPNYIAWTPIGTLSTHYKGTFDGNGKKIVGLTVNLPKTDFVGLFGYVEGVTNDEGEIIGGIIRNVALEGGVIVGRNGVGGVIGENYEGVGLNCYNTGAVNGIGNQVGGVIGENYEGVVLNCYNTGAVNGLGGNVGGVVGMLDGSFSGSVSNCYNTGTVNGYDYVGGVIGYNHRGIVLNCYSTGTVNGNDCVGGVVGGTDWKVSNCYNAGDVIGVSHIGGVIGFSEDDNDYGRIKNCYYDKSVCSKVGGAINGNDDALYQHNVIGLTTDDMTGRRSSSYDKMNGFFNSDGTSSVWMGRGSDSFYCYYPHLKGFNLDASGEQLAPENIRKTDWAPRMIQKNVMEVSNYDELKEFASKVNDDGTAVLKGILLHDIDASASANGNTWTPIGTEKNPYKGTFDGNGYKINGLTLKAPLTDYVGLFGYVGDTTQYNVAYVALIRDVGMEGGLLSGKDYVGGLVGRLSLGVVENCYNTGDVKGGNFVGGAIGHNSYTVSNCYSTGDVEGSNNGVGGVVGDNSGTVSNCYNTGDVEGWVSYVGGVVGDNSGTVSNCYNTGAVNGRDSVGGVIGRNNDTVSNCFNTGDVTGGSNNVGGVAGYSFGYNKRNAIIQNCYNTGAVTGQGYVGGVAGSNGGINANIGKATVQNCYNIGGVSGLHDIGGVAGENSNEGLVQSCYNTGDVFEDNESAYHSLNVIGIGGVVGNNTTMSTIQNCYNSGCVYGKNAREVVVGGVVGNNTALCTVQNCYNTGVVNGNNAGGVAGNNHNSTVKNCYYDSYMCINGAVNGNDDANNSVLGLTSVQMTGEGVIGADSSMKFTWEEGESSPWLEKADSDCDGKHYFYYPHLKGFDWKNEKGICEEFPLITAGSTQMSAEEIDSVNWPAKVEVSVTWDKADSYVFDGTPQGPTVKKVTVGEADSPEGSTSVAFFVNKNGDWIETEGEPDSPGTYKMKIAFADSKETVTKYFAILDADLYPVTYDDSSTEGCINAGAHTAAVKFEEYKDETGEKKKRSVEESFTIKPDELTLTASSGTETYDGTEKTVSGFACRSKRGNIDGLSFSGVSAGRTETDAGKYDVTFTGVTLNTTKDTTGNYVVTKVEDGKLTINPAGVTLTANNGTENYDGTEKSVSGFTCSVQGKTVQGLEFTDVSASGKGTVPGKYDVTFEGVTKNTTEDKTGNYVVTETVDGTLTIEKAGEFTISLEDASYEYDGKSKAITTSPTTTTAGGETTFEYSKEKDGTYVSDLSSLTATKVSDSCTIYVRATNPNYEKTATCTAKLTITAKKVTITADSDTKGYDGTSLTVGTYGYTTLAGGDRVESVTIRGSQTEAGSSKNEISNAKIVNGSNEDVTDCYSITYVDGTLTIGKAEGFTVSLEGASYEYDGTPKAITSSPTTTAAGGDTTFEYSKEKDGTYVTDLSSLTATKVSESCTIYVRATNLNYKNTAVCTAELTITRASAPEMSALSDGEKPAAATELVENGEKQLLLTEPETLPEGYTAIKYSSDDGKTWTTEIPEESEAGTYTIKTRYTADDNHTDFEGETYEVTIKALYAVIWKDGDGSTLDTKTYVEGETEPTTNKTPIKAADENHKYVFKAWKQPGTVEGKTTTYTPEFLEIDKEVYTVVWLNGDDSVLESKTYKEDETEPTTDKIPTKNPDADYTYQFTGWDNGEVEGKTKTYRGYYEATPKTKYTVIWLNGDGTELDSKAYKEGAEEPTTDKTPTKDPDEDNKYVFQAWKQPGTVSADGKTTTYEPEFMQISKDVFAVVWLNGDGTILDSKTFKEDETEPTTDKIPTMAEDADNTYQFTGWDNGEVEGKTKTYRGIYEATPKTEYTVIWLNGDGTELDRKTYKEGAQEPTTDKTPVKDPDADNTYVFQAWKQPGTVDGLTTTYEPEFLQIAKDVFAVVWLNGDGTVLDSKTYKEGEAEPKTDRTPTRSDTEEFFYEFLGWSDGTVSGTITTYEPMFLEVPKEMYKLLNAVYEWKKGSDGTIVITVKRAQDDANCITYFSAVRIGNVLVPGQDYTAEAGSTVITLKNEYLNTLNPGEYNVEIEFVDGKVTAELQVLEAEKTVTPTPTVTPSLEPSPTPVPSEPSAKTGDTSNLWLWAILTIIASGVLGGVVAGKRARKAM